MKKCLKCNKSLSKIPKETWEQWEKRKFCSIKCVRIHGMSRTPFYAVWCRIQRVCNDPREERYSLYGGRGIRCLWNSFEKFKSDMYKSYQSHLKKFGKLNTTIERIDNDSNYSKENCRWATRREQARNRRNRVEITYRGKTHSVVEWAEIFKLPKVTLWLRLFRQKWSVEKSFNTPCR